jgi:peroxiredoxin
MTTPFEEIVILHGGDPAPPFSLPAWPPGVVSLSDYRNKQHLVLVFYHSDKADSNLRDLCILAEHVAQFTAEDTVVLAVSCDSLQSHETLSRQYRIPFPLLADEARQVGLVYGAVKGDRYRADDVQFVIDKEGIIRHVHEENPDVEALLAMVRRVRAAPPVSAVPDLIAALDHHEPAVRARALETLGEMGPGAKGALPSLERAHQEGRVGPEVHDAILAIMDEEWSR